MKTQKIAMAVILSIVWLTGFASSKDWNGTFTIRNYIGETQTVIHTPDYVKYLFIQSGTCTFFGKGLSLNGMIFQDNVELCTNANVEKFTSEVQKLGLILNKNIALGSTYQN